MQREHQLSSQTLLNCISFKVISPHSTLQNSGNWSNEYFRRKRPTIVGLKLPSEHVRSLSRVIGERSIPVPPTVTKAGPGEVSLTASASSRMAGPTTTRTGIATSRSTARCSARCCCRMAIMSKAEFLPLPIRQWRQSFQSKQHTVATADSGNAWHIAHAARVTSASRAGPHPSLLHLSAFSSDGPVKANQSAWSKKVENRS